MATHKDRMAVIKRQTASRQEAGFKAEVHPGCPLGDLAHPNRRPEVFRAGVRLVLEEYEKPAQLIEREIDSNCRVIMEYSEELTAEEKRLVNERAFECSKLRADGRCVLMNCVQMEAQIA